MNLKLQDDTATTSKAELKVAMAHTSNWWPIYIDSMNTSTTNVFYLVLPTRSYWTTSSYSQHNGSNNVMDLHTIFFDAERFRFDATLHETEPRGRDHAFWGLCFLFSGKAQNEWRYFPGSNIRNAELRRGMMGIDRSRPGKDLICSVYANAYIHSCMYGNLPAGNSVSPEIPGNGCVFYFVRLRFFFGDSCRSNFFFDCSAFRFFFSASTNLYI